MATPGYVFRDGGPIPDCDLPPGAHDSVKPGEIYPEQLGSRGQRDADSPRKDSGVDLHDFADANTQQQNSNAAEPTATNIGSQVSGMLNEARSSIGSALGAATTTSAEAQNSTSNARKRASAANQHALSDGETDSHALATAIHEHEEIGVAQEEHFASEVRDLGWHEDIKKMPGQLVGGLSNEELWMMIRRFNKQMYHVKAMDQKPLAGLDLNIADKDEFSPDKLRANVERLYMTVIVGLMSAVNHVARLRSWREPRRTAVFCGFYFAAWILDLLMPLFFTMIVALIMVPQIRPLLFPPAPIALVNSKTGGVQTPKAGVLGSHDSLTGAPENHQGEAVEQEASNFVAGIGTIALSSAVGKDDKGDPGTDSLSKRAPDPTRIATAGSEAQASASGAAVTEKHDKTKEPVQDAMWSQMRPVMHVIGDIADGWERFGNALSPTTPFPKLLTKLKLASIFAPGILVSLVTSSYLFTKLSMFIVGVAFFTDPLLWRGLDWLNKNYPDWQKLLELRNSLLKGVPTNAQLTITLLRIGEGNRAPLPPPPGSNEAPPSRPASLNGEDLTLDASESEIQEAINKDEQTAGSSDGKDSAGKPSKLMGLMKGTTNAGVQTKLGADSVRATIGSSTAKNHLGAVPGAKDQVFSGPVDYKARYRGNKGWVYINTSATVPCVAFSQHKSKAGNTGEESDKDLKPVFSIAIDQIQEVKKIGGFGWKTKIIVGWATEKNVIDGLDITDKKGTTVRLTAIVLRDELFNRLVSMGKQSWESW